MSILGWILIGLGLAAFLRPKFQDDSTSIRILFYWAIAAAISFLPIPIPFKFLLYPIFLIALTPPKIIERGSFFLFSFIAVPAGAPSFDIPFPGINYLFRIDHLLTVIFFVAIPIMFASSSLKHRTSKLKDPLTDTLIIVTITYAGLLIFRDTASSMTNNVRELVMFAIHTALVYFAFSRTISTRTSIEAYLRGSSAIGTWFVILGFLTFLFNWNMYASLGGNFNAASEYRGGTIRVELTTEKTLAGLFFIGTIAALWLSRHQAKFGKFTAYLWCLGGFMGLIWTQSRGAYVACILALGTYFLLKIRSWPLRLTIVSVSAIGLFILYSILSSTNFQNIDQYGTFEYRERLIQTSIEHIKAHPFIGDENYRSNPRFEPLRQGEGIIDFVNSYLQITLKWGLIGLFLHLLLFARIGLGLVNAIDRLKLTCANERDVIGFGEGLCVLFAAYLWVIFSTSLVSFIPYMMFVFIGLGSAYIRFSKHLVQTYKDENGSSEQESDEEVGTQSSTPKEEREDDFVIDVSPGVKGWS